MRRPASESVEQLGLFHYMQGKIRKDKRSNGIAQDDGRIKQSPGLRNTRISIKTEGGKFGKGGSMLHSTRILNDALDKFLERVYLRLS